MSFFHAFMMYKELLLRFLVLGSQIDKSTPLRWDGKLINISDYYSFFSDRCGKSEQRSKLLFISFNISFMILDF